MESLIWFSMPGAILTATIALLWPATIAETSRATLMALATPLIGFVLHQAFRVWFEASGRFARNSRRSIDDILTIARSIDMQLTRDQAFLVWETTFYSSSFPASFRDHDRGAWHYILSFWGMGFAAGVSSIFLIFCFLSGMSSVSFSTLAIALVLMVTIGLLLYWKAKQTYRALLDEECAMIRLHRNLFIETLKSLHSAATPS